MMIKKMFKSVFFRLISIAIASTTFLSEVSPVLAGEMNYQSNVDNSMGIVIEESSDNLDGSKTRAFPDLGDDQAFPFIPGFGKNSGKD